MMSELQSETYIACYSETDNPTLFQYAVTQVKDKLVEDYLVKACPQGLQLRASKHGRQTRPR